MDTGGSGGGGGGAEDVGVISGFGGADVGVVDVGPVSFREAVTGCVRNLPKAGLENNCWLAPMFRTGSQKE